ncbi:unnamed protein product [Cuscuta europaea]|uniref:feruloyl-CoA 6-hydroxylase n=1 Tax=Cuscuta europaea TaxID=41803 RepID=A0A9P0Z7B0_CUSEU|nr:unnamed protein product [Cuscuta europaea]
MMTNGIFKSPVHRVLSSSQRDRISVAMFYVPEIGKEIGPEEGLLLDGEKQRVYKKVKDYGDLYLENYVPKWEGHKTIVAHSTCLDAANKFYQYASIVVC